MDGGERARTGLCTRTKIRRVGGYGCLPEVRDVSGVGIGWIPDTRHDFYGYRVWVSGISMYLFLRIYVRMYVFVFLRE